MMTFLSEGKRRPNCAAVGMAVSTIIVSHKKVRIVCFIELKGISVLESDATVVVEYRLIGLHLFVVELHGAVV